MEIFLHISPSRSGHNFIKENLKSWKKFHYKNFEDKNPKDIHFDNFKWYGNITDVVTVISTRDLLNWLASKIKRIREFKKGITLKESIDHWTSISKEFLGITSYQQPSINIYYDHFYESEKYRRNICETIGGTYSEEKINYVSWLGLGSSFDGREYDGKGSEMNVLERYKQIDKDILLRILKMNPEALDIYKNGFPLNDDKKEFLTGL